MRPLFSVGDKVGDYQIVAKLRSGGMATLFLGRREGVEGFSRHVAIKVVHEHLAEDEMFVRMFVDEALLSAKIQHPNVVHVEALGESGGRHFLVMEYVHGCALSTLLTSLGKLGRTLTPQLATYIAVKVAEGLHAAHETKDGDGQLLGVVHRDVTPQNVLIAYRGHVKLIDFGVAKARGRAQQTTGGSLKGKIGYMSPEQAFGESVDRRTDVYALGVVLWEMLTGRRAFKASNELALLQMVRDPKLVPASTYNASVPPALDAVIAKATAREAADRFSTAQEMRRALAKAMPAALALDASDIERLLRAVVGNDMETERQLLPESVSGLLSDPGAPEEPSEQVVATLTVSAVDLESEPASIDVPIPSGVSELDDERALVAAGRRRFQLAAVLVAGLTFGVVVGGVYRALGSGDDEAPSSVGPVSAPTRSVDSRPNEGVHRAPIQAEAALIETPDAGRAEHEVSGTGEPSESDSADGAGAERPTVTPDAGSEPAPRPRIRRRRRARRPRRRSQPSTTGVPLADEF